MREKEGGDPIGMAKDKITPPLHYPEIGLALSSGDLPFSPENAENSPGNVHTSEGKDDRK